MSHRLTPASTLPTPTGWQITLNCGGRDTSAGVLTINSLVENIVLGTINFRGMPIPISGSWHDQTRQIKFQSSDTIFTGVLTTLIEAGIMHCTLSGNYASTSRTVFAWTSGNWEANAATFC